MPLELPAILGRDASGAVIERWGRVSPGSRPGMRVVRSRHGRLRRARRLESRRSPHADRLELGCSLLPDAVAGLENIEARVR